MIAITPAAADYLLSLIEQQQLQDYKLRVSVQHPGTPVAACALDFVLGDSIEGRDVEVMTASGIGLILDPATAPLLTEASIDFVDNGQGGGDLIVQAPNIKGKAPEPSAPLVTRLQYVLDAEINPGLAAHGGQVSVDRFEAGELYLRFGGGCQGCSMVDVTLKSGITDRLREQFPEIIDIIDVTDHAEGLNPYA